MPRWSCLLALFLIQQTTAAHALDESRVLARAICSGQGKAVETQLATRHPDLNVAIEVSPTRSLRPLTLAMLCLQSVRQAALPEHMRQLGSPLLSEAAMVELLLRLGADPVYQEADLEQQTPLHLVFQLPREQQADMLQLLLTYFAERDLGIKDAQGETPRELAVHANPELAKVIGSYQPTGLSDMNIRLEPFAYAAGAQVLEQMRRQELLLELISGQRREQAKALLAKGLAGDIYLLEPVGRPLLHQLALQGQRDWLELLLHAGANIRIRDYQQREVLHLLATADQPGLIRWLAGRGASVNSRDEQGESPLFAAIRAGRHKNVALLLQLGADPQLHNHAGQNPVGLVRELAEKQPLEYKAMLRLFEGN